MFKAIAFKITKVLNPFAFVPSVSTVPAYDYAAHAEAINTRP